jgi:hypothetical protein
MAPRPPAGVEDPPIVDMQDDYDSTPWTCPRYDEHELHGEDINHNNIYIYIYIYKYHNLYGVERES